MTRIIFACLAMSLALSVCPAWSAPVRLAASDGPVAGKARAVEREKRFLQRVLDDLRNTRKLAEEDIGELERQTDAITILESPRREEDFQNLLGWYYRYLDWLLEQEDEIDGELARLSAGSVSFGEFRAGRYGAMAKRTEELAEELNEKVRGYDAEGKRLAGILDRRRLLRAQFSELEEQLALIDKRHAETRRPLSDEEMMVAKRLRLEVRVVQTELFSLPDIDEDILKHYAVMIERGRWEGDRLALKADEYEALGEVAALLPRAASRDAEIITEAYRRLIRTYERGIGRLGRMMDELDRKSSRVSPAGTLREMDRSRELADFYQRLRERYDERIRQLKVQIGACQAELAELLAGQP